MKKTLVAIAALAAFGAQAQAVISGGISTGIMNTGAANADTGVAHLGNGANAININTTEDLGGGLKGGFTGQIRFKPDTGDIQSSGAAGASTTGTSLFHSANAYISGGMGTVRVGKIAEQGNCGMDPWGCTAGASLMGGVGVSALIGAGSQGSSVFYSTPTVAGFSATYQTSMTQPTERTNERKVMTVGYTNGPLTLSYVGTDGSVNSAANGTAITDVAGKGRSIGAAYMIGKSTVRFVNAVTEDASGVKTANVNSLNATVPLSGPFTLLAGYNKAKVGTGYTATAATDTKTAVGVNYALSKRTTLGADVFKAEAAGASTGYVARIAHNF